MRLTRAEWVRLLLLWLAGVDLLLTLLAVPPLIPNIHRELNLDEKAVGALVSLPVVLFALAAVPGALLITKLGIRRAIGIGLGLVAVFGALRGFGPSAPVLFGATFLMGIGVAVRQPAVSSPLREWVPPPLTLCPAIFRHKVLFGQKHPNDVDTPLHARPGR